MACGCGFNNVFPQELPTGDFFGAANGGMEQHCGCQGDMDARIMRAFREGYAAGLAACEQSEPEQPYQYDCRCQCRCFRR